MQISFRRPLQNGVAILGCVTLCGTFFANARPIYARKEKKACAFCHLRKEGGGARSFRGMYYGAHAHSFKGFNEKVQARKAGVKMHALGQASRPTKPYNGG